MQAGLLRDLAIACTFYTRLPLRVQGPVEGADFARALWAGPLAGLLVGGSGALAFWLAAWAGLPPLVAALLALAATALLTGALHEDGLADAADGLGGGRDRAAKLSIMRDSRLGSYGALALLLSIGLRAAALASLSPAEALGALVAAHAAGRGLLPFVLALLPPARADGLAAAAVSPPARTLAAAALLSVAALVAGLGAGAGLLALLLLTLAGVAFLSLVRRQVGGYTGDLLGALEQTAEILVLLTAAAR